MKVISESSIYTTSSVLDSATVRVHNHCVSRMASQNYPLRNIDIYRNLPTFDPKITGLTAIVTGANGISGFYTMRALLDSPNRWTKIYALSRRPPSKEMMNLLTVEQQSRVQHVACDFLQSASTIAQAMKNGGVTADYVFFYSYLQPSPPPGSRIWSNADELVKVNSALLANFLEALEIAMLNPRRVLLQTGAKNYGIHIGRSRQPACETDPQPKHLEPNFYYDQEKSLFEYCKRNPATGWNVIRPAWIIGAVTNAQMNALHPYAVYAAVQARRGLPIQFGGDWTNWQQTCFHSTARLTGYFSEWVVLEDKCKNEAFNSTDTSPFTFDRFFEELCRWYGVSGFIAPDEDDSKYDVIVGRKGANTPMGYGPSLDMRISFSLVKWAKDPVNRDAWQEIIETSNGKVNHDPFQDPEAHFSCADAAWLTMTLCTNKARRLGWTGFVDTMESVFEMYRDMVGLGMLPPMIVDSPKPLI